MDLSSMLNAGPAPPTRPESSSTPSDPNFQATIRSSQQHALFPASSSGTPSIASGSQGMTPVKTPSHMTAGAQHPYGHHSMHPNSESPILHTAPQNQHSAEISAPPSASRAAAQLPGQPVLQRANSSNLHMAMPPSQSPASHPPQSQFYHHSQPSTPLGPPPLLQRSSYQYENANPFPPRALSIPVNGLVTKSPAQSHPGIGNLMDSPGGRYRRPSPHRPSTGDFRSSVERERSSVSVSPKTKVPTRAPSLGSHQSSLHEHNSVQSRSSSAAVAEGYPNNAAHSSGFPASHLSGFHSANEAMQQVNSPGSMTDSSHRGGTPLQPNNISPLIQHNVQKMGMDRLLSSAAPQPSFRNGASHDGGTYEPGHLEQRPGTSSTTSGFAPDAGPMPRQTPSRSPVVSAQVLIDETAGLPFPHERQPLKRSAGSTSSFEPPPKRGRQRKYTTRPVWAQISPLNQRLKGGVSTHAQSTPRNTHPQPVTQPQPRSQPATQSIPKQEGSQANGHPPSTPTNGTDLLSISPWRHDPPLDHDLLHARSILGQWEKTCKYSTPIPSMVRAIMDWFYVQLESVADVGNDPLEGAIEIEAKIGTLVNPKDGTRCSLPVKCATLIDPSVNRQYTFESQMNELEHQKMNAFLNSVIRDSREKGRVPLTYEHTKEIDSFRALSDAGFRALPPSCANRWPPGREPKLRTTTSEKTGQVTARIVKIPLGDIHIFNPNDPYDARISMNLEVNLHNRSDIPDAGELGVEPTFDRPAAPDRRKDRLSYRHLAYSIDLTRVDVKGLAPKFELELEVNAGLLREQMALMKANRDNAVSTIVEGFLDNATFLMRQRP